MSSTGTKLHALLAVEKTKASALGRLVDDTKHKFGKPEYFKGHIKTLKMLEDNPANTALEESSREHKNLPTTVQETLDYLMKFWADHEDILFQKNKSNQLAKADLMFRGNVLVRDVPVDELLGLESRLESLRGLMHTMPTLDAAGSWVVDSSLGRPGVHVSKDDSIVIKTEKKMTAVVLYEATDKHPAQIEKIQQDVPVGKFIWRSYSGAATSLQKAEVLSVLDDLISEAKQARMRANNTDIVTDKIGGVITGLIMEALRK